MDDILTYSKNPEDDYYNILGCDDTSSVEQIITEYKVRALDLHPDKNPGNSQSVDLFKKLQHAKEVLCDPEQRKLYDKWKGAGFAMPFEKWANLSKSAHTSMHWANKKVKEPMLLPGTSGACTATQKSQPEREVVAQFSPIEKSKYWVPETGNEMLQKFRNYQI